MGSKNIILKNRLLSNKEMRKRLLQPLNFNVSTFQVEFFSLQNCEPSFMNVCVWALFFSEERVIRFHPILKQDCKLSLPWFVRRNEVGWSMPLGRLSNILMSPHWGQQKDREYRASPPLTCVKAIFTYFSYRNSFILKKKEIVLFYKKYAKLVRENEE